MYTCIDRESRTDRIRLAFCHRRPRLRWHLDASAEFSLCKAVQSCVQTAGERRTAPQARLTNLRQSRLLTSDCNPGQRVMSDDDCVLVTSFALVPRPRVAEGPHASGVDTPCVTVPATSVRRAAVKRFPAAARQSPPASQLLCRVGCP